MRTTEGKRYLLRFTDAWTLESGFNGAELFARPSITLVTIEATTIREAEQ